MPSPSDDFRRRFEAIMGVEPMPWQESLYARMTAGAGGSGIPEALPLPTGLGKTAVMVVWYLALRAGAKVPRRLVYVVDRRAVVDQASELARRLRESAGDGDGLAISTLRGQHADNREWLADPAGPAIIVGTIDMIGSRLLFSGYGVSTGMRPYHAGLLGADSLFVLDEAHLCPPFEALLQTVVSDTEGTGDPALVPRPRLMVMSATGNGDTKASVLNLSPADHAHPVVSERLNAAKHLTLTEPSGKLAPALADAALERLKTHPKARLLVYCHSRRTALQVRDAIAKARKDLDKDGRINLLVGARRVREREALADWLLTRGFTHAPDKSPEPGPAVLVATAAGEVGVDLDADHMVCDLVEWERMVQRLGRVNRRGGDGRKAQVTVIAATEVPGKDASVLAAPLDALPKTEDGAFAASPAALAEVTDIPDAAKADQPLHPLLTPALAETFAMTSLPDHPARPPEVTPWLRGWPSDKEQPEATVVWRRVLPLGKDGAPLPKADEARFLETARPHLLEGLETSVGEIGKWLKDLAKAREKVRDKENTPPLPGYSAFVLAPKGTVLTRLAETELAQAEIPPGATLLLDARLGGLSKDGMLDATVDAMPATLDDGSSEAVGLWVTGPDSKGADNAEWRLALELPVGTEAEADAGGDGPAIRVYVARKADADRRGDPAISRAPQTLADHAAMTAKAAEEIARALGLPEAHADMLRLAAEAHDAGKNRPRWQNAMGAPPGGGRPYAKTGGTGGGRGLDGYRHEFGSLGDLLKDDRLNALPEDLRDLALHLVTAHHGHARPVIAPLDDAAPPPACEARTLDATLRFARLQRRWGPWGLAWWEALLRAADRRASIRHDQNPEG